MKKKIGVIVALSIMITGINYPTYSVYAQEENQDIFLSYDEDPRIVGIIVGNFIPLKI